MSDLSSSFVELGKGTIHYYQLGQSEGPVMLVFHGFGEKGKKYKVFESSVGKKYKMIAVDLPWHGKTKWTRGKLFEKRDLATLLGKLQEKEQFQEFSLFGYSLGGKVALGCLEINPEKIREVFLLAPDGVKTNFWYDLATYPTWGQRLLKYVMKHPKMLFVFIKWLRKLRLIRKSLVKFTFSQMETAEQRQKIYQVWMTFRNFHVDMEKLYKLIPEYRILLHLIFGQYDRIIKPEVGRKFARKFPKKLCSLHIVSVGHDLVVDQLNPVLLKILDRDH